MKKGYIYRYHHPEDCSRFLYVGQVREHRRGERDKEHRKLLKSSSFGKRFRLAFPGKILPKPVYYAVSVEDLDFEETVAMFRFHTWQGFPGGMNLSLPGFGVAEIAAVTGKIMGDGNAKIWKSVGRHACNRTESCPFCKQHKIKMKRRLQYGD